MSKMRTPKVITTFGQWIASQRIPPLLPTDERRLCIGPFDVIASYSDNAAVAEDLTPQSKWPVDVQNLFGTSSSIPVKAELHLTAVQLYINDADFRGETQALREALDNNAYLYIVRGGASEKVPLRSHITESQREFEFHEATNTSVERGLFLGPPRRLARARRIDLETDTLQLVGAAINWGSGAIAVYVRLFGALAPKGYPGTGVQDGDCSVATDDPVGVTPDFVRYGVLTGQGGFDHVNGAIPQPMFR